jgi:hypothetical protein
MKWRIKLAKKMAMTLYVSDVYSKLLSFLITFDHSSYLKKIRNCHRFYYQLFYHTKLNMTYNFTYLN